MNTHEKMAKKMTKKILKKHTARKSFQQNIMCIERLPTTQLLEEDNVIHSKGYMYSVNSQCKIKSLKPVKKSLDANEDVYRRDKEKHKDIPISNISKAIPGKDKEKCVNGKYRDVEGELDEVKQQTPKFRLMKNYSKGGKHFDRMSFKNLSSNSSAYPEKDSSFDFEKLKIPTDKIKHQVQESNMKDHGLSQHSRYCSESLGKHGKLDKKLKHKLVTDYKSKDSHSNKSTHGSHSKSNESQWNKSKSKDSHSIKSVHGFATVSQDLHSNRSRHRSDSKSKDSHRLNSTNITELKSKDSLSNSHLRHKPDSKSNKKDSFPGKCMNRSDSKYKDSHPKKSLHRTVSKSEDSQLNISRPVSKSKESHLEKSTHGPNLNSRVSDSKNMLGSNSKDSYSTKSSHEFDFPSAKVFNKEIHEKHQSSEHVDSKNNLACNSELNHQVDTHLMNKSVEKLGVGTKDIQHTNSSTHKVIFQGKTPVIKLEKISVDNLMKLGKRNMSKVFSDMSPKCKVAKNDIMENEQKSVEGVTDKLESTSNKEKLPDNLETKHQKELPLDNEVEKSDLMVKQKKSKEKPNLLIDGSKHQKDIAIQSDLHKCSVIRYANGSKEKSLMDVDSSSVCDNRESCDLDYPNNTKIDSKTGGYDADDSHTKVIPISLQHAQLVEPNIDSQTACELPTETDVHEMSERIHLEFIEQHLVAREDIKISQVEVLEGSSAKSQQQVCRSLDSEFGKAMGYKDHLARCALVRRDSTETIPYGGDVESVEQLSFVDTRHENEDDGIEMESERPDSLKLHIHDPVDAELLRNENTSSSSLSNSSQKNSEETTPTKSPYVHPSSNVKIPLHSPLSLKISQDRDFWKTNLGSFRNSVATEPPSSQAQGQCPNSQAQYQSSQVQCPNSQVQYQSSHVQCQSSQSQYQSSQSQYQSSQVHTTSSQHLDTQNQTPNVRPQYQQYPRHQVPWYPSTQIDGNFQQRYPQVGFPSTVHHYSSTAPQRYPRPTSCYPTFMQQRCPLPQAPGMSQPTLSCQIPTVPFQPSVPWNSSHWHGLPWNSSHMHRMPFPYSNNPHMIPPKDSMSLCGQMRNATCSPMYARDQVNSPNECHTLRSGTRTTIVMDTTHNVLESSSTVQSEVHEPLEAGRKSPQKRPYTPQERPHVPQKGPHAPQGRLHGSQERAQPVPAKTPVAQNELHIAPSESPSVQTGPVEETSLPKGSVAEMDDSEWESKPNIDGMSPFPLDKLPSCFREEYERIFQWLQDKQDPAEIMTEAHKAFAEVTRRTVRNHEKLKAQYVANIAEIKAEIKRERELRIQKEQELLKLQRALNLAPEIDDE